jgi:hypothetical protein
MDPKLGYDTMNETILPKSPFANECYGSDDSIVVERGALKDLSRSQTEGNGEELKIRTKKDGKSQSKSPFADKANDADVIERGAKQSQTPSQTEPERKPKTKDDSKDDSNRARKKGQQEAEEDGGQKAKPQGNKDENPKGKSSEDMTLLKDIRPLKTSGKDFKELLRKTGHSMTGLEGAEKVDILQMMFEQVKGVLELRGQMELEKETLLDFLVLEGMPAQGTKASQACLMLSELRVLQIARLGRGYGTVPSEAEQKAASQHEEFKQCLEVCVLEEVEDIFGQSMR